MSGSRTREQVPDPGLTDRRALIARMVEVANARPDAERVRLPWRTGEYFATVVELPLEAVLLNPHSHRIRAQLESSPARDQIENNPLSDQSQVLISNLLREVSEFEDLRANLKDVGQIEPGVVTADGLLINANTRCVALRDIQAKYVRAAVLPGDATAEEIDRLELRLQMKRDFHSDYTFSNELLFIEDLVRRYRYQPEAIAIEMGWASRADAKALARKAEQASSYLRMLAIIREVQHMAEGRLQIVQFDGSRQALMELDEEIERLKASDYEAARELRDARLVGLLAGAGYRELRKIDANFIDNYLVPSMEERPGLRPFIESLTVPADQPSPAGDPVGLELFDDPAPALAEPRRSATPMLELLTKSHGTPNVTVRSSEGNQLELDRIFFCNELRLAIEGAAEDVRLDREQGDLVSRPLELVRKAIRQTRLAIDAYGMAADRPEFEIDRMRSLSRELGATHADLAKLVEIEPPTS